MRRKPFRKAPYWPFSSQRSCTCWWRGWQDLASNVTQRVSRTLTRPRYSPSFPRFPVTTARAKLQSPWLPSSSLSTVPYTAITAGQWQLPMKIQLLGCQPLLVYRVLANTDCKTICRYVQCSAIRYKHTIQYNAIECDTMIYSTVQCNTIRWNMIHHMIKYIKIQCYWNLINPPCPRLNPGAVRQFTTVWV